MPGKNEKIQNFQTFEKTILEMKIKTLFSNKCFIHYK